MGDYMGTKSHSNERLFSCKLSEILFLGRVFASGFTGTWKHAQILNH
jgi:hypothetical protein